MSEPLLTIQDCRDCGFCVSSVRSRGLQLGFDFRRFVREGIPLSELEAVDDPEIRRACERARIRIANEAAEQRK